MAKLQVVDQNNKKVGDIELAPEVFEVEIQPEVLNLVVRYQRAAVRQGTHATKNRALKNGGGRKPWRQKGTGRARAGSNRSPLWREVQPLLVRSPAITPSRLTRRSASWPCRWLCPPASLKIS